MVKFFHKVNEYKLYKTPKHIVGFLYRCEPTTQEISNIFLMNELNVSVEDNMLLSQSIDNIDNFDLQRILDNLIMSTGKCLNDLDNIIKVELKSDTEKRLEQLRQKQLDDLKAKSEVIDNVSIETAEKLVHTPLTIQLFINNREIKDNWKIYATQDEAGKKYIWRMEITKDTKTKRNKKLDSLENTFKIRVNMALNKIKGIQNYALQTQALVEFSGKVNTVYTELRRLCQRSLIRTDDEFRKDLVNIYRKIERLGKLSNYDV